MKPRSVKVSEVSTYRTPAGRWIIVLPAARDWAWSGSRWVNHRNGVSLEAPVCVFDTEGQALEYARQYLLDAPPAVSAPADDPLPTRKRPADSSRQ